MGVKRSFTRGDARNAGMRMQNGTNVSGKRKPRESRVPAINPDRLAELQRENPDAIVTVARSRCGMRRAHMVTYYRK